MDNVTKDTPIILKKNENNKFLRVDKLIGEEAWYQDENVVISWIYQEIGDCIIKQVWTNDGWKNI